MSELDACLLARFPGIRPPDWLRRWLDDGLGGVLLFAENITDPAQLRALAADLRAHNPEVLIAADEEGGSITRVEARTGSSYPGNGALGAVGDAGVTRQVAASIGAMPLVLAVRDAHRPAWQRELVGRVQARRPDAVVVGTGTVHDRELADGSYPGHPGSRPGQPGGGRRRAARPGRPGMTGSATATELIDGTVSPHRVRCATFPPRRPRTEVSRAHR